MIRLVVLAAIAAVTLFFALGVTRRPPSAPFYTIRPAPECKLATDDHCWTYNVPTARDWNEFFIKKEERR